MQETFSLNPSKTPQDLTQTHLQLVVDITALKQEIQEMVASTTHKQMQKETGLTTKPQSLAATASSSMLDKTPI